MEGNTLKDNKVKQAVLELLRMGVSVASINDMLNKAYADLQQAVNYQPMNHDIGEYHQAIRDADFRP